MLNGKPLCIDLFCGLGGWTEGFLAEGYRVVGFDITRHRYESRAQSENDSAIKVGGIDFNGYGTPGYKAVAFNGTAEKRLGPKTGGWTEYPAQLVLQLWGDVAQVGSRIVVGDGGFGAGLRVPGKGGKNEGGSWFKIANNTESGLGRHPVHALTVGQKRNPDGTDHPTGSWFRIADSSQGDRGQKVPGFRFDGSGRSFQTAAVEAHHGAEAHAAQLERIADLSKVAPEAAIQMLGTKIGGDWFRDPACHSKHGSRSNARKAASAMIAKIPLPLSRYVAQQYKPASVVLEAMA